MTTPLERIMYATHRLIRAERLAMECSTPKRAAAVTKRKNELVELCKRELWMAKFSQQYLFK